MIPSSGLGDHGPVPPLALGPVEAFVGLADEGIGLALVGRLDGSGPNADGDLFGRRGGRVGDGQAPDGLADPLGDVLGPLDARVLEEDGELGAPVAGRVVAWPAGRGLDGPGHPDQAFVPGHLAVGVVISLEMVDVAEKDGQGAAGPDRAAPAPPELLLEHPAVGDLGQVVDLGQAPELLVLLVQLLVRPPAFRLLLLEEALHDEILPGVPLNGVAGQHAQDVRADEKEVLGPDGLGRRVEDGQGDDLVGGDDQEGGHGRPDEAHPGPGVEDDEDQDQARIIGIPGLALDDGRHGHDAQSAEQGPEGQGPLPDAPERRGIGQKIDQGAQGQEAGQANEPERLHGRGGHRRVQVAHIGRVFVPDDGLGLGLVCCCGAYLGDIRPHFLGAHAVPADMKKNDYIDLICYEMIPLIAKRKLAVFIDVFCEKGYFDAAETERILSTGAKFGLIPKIHSEQFNSIGGVKTAVKVKAISIDHLEVLKGMGIRQLKNTGIIAVLLPGASYFLDISYPPAREIIGNGIPVALATDFNPGSCMTENMQMIMSLASVKMKMTAEEIINAVTINGAYAIFVQNLVGSLEAGKQSDVLVFGFEYYKDLIYHFGVNQIEKVFKKGKRVV